MKCVMIFVSCVLAAASAGYTAHLYSAPVVGPSSYAYQNAHPPANYAVAYNAPVAHGYAHGGYYGAEARLVDPVAIAAGAPLPVGDTFEVAAAKAAHFKAHAAARSHADTAPLAHSYSLATPVSQGYAHAGYFGAEASLVDPIAIAAGAPFPVGDTNEVAAAKAAHFKAHAVARGHAHAAPLAHSYSLATPVSYGYAQGYAHAAPVAHVYAHGGHYASEARLVDPVAIAAGAPLPGGDTYEVAAAKAAHLQAHAAVKSGHHGSYYG